MNKLQDRMLRAYIRGNGELKSFIHQDDGDTNFISIAIILVIVIGMAAAFFSFRDDIMDAVSTQVSKLVTNLSTYGEK